MPHEMARLLDDLRHEIVELRQEIHQLREQRRPGFGRARLRCSGCISLVIPLTLAIKSPPTKQE